MTAWVGIVIWLLVAALAVFVLALVTPLHIELTATKDDKWRFSAALRPYGRFGPLIAMSKGPKKAETAPSAPQKKRTKRSAWKRKPQGMARAAVRLLSDLVHCVRLNAATVDMTFGLGDPGETGQVFGLMAPLIYGPSRSGRVSLNIVPAFDRAVLTGRMAMDVSFVPVALLAPVARFGWAAFGPRT